MSISARLSGRALSSSRASRALLSVDLLPNTTELTDPGTTDEWFFLKIIDKSKSSQLQSKTKLSKSGKPSPFNHFLAVSLEIGRRQPGSKENSLAIAAADLLPPNLSIKAALSTFENFNLTSSPVVKSTPFSQLQIGQSITN